MPAENSVREIPQRLRMLTPWIRRKSAVSDHLGGHALVGFLDPIFEDLQIGMAVKIDESRSNHATGTIDGGALRQRFHRADCGNASVFDQYIARITSGARAIDN